MSLNAVNPCIVIIQLGLLRGHFQIFRVWQQQVRLCKKTFLLHLSREASSGRRNTNRFSESEREKCVSAAEYGSSPHTLDNRVTGAGIYFNTADQQAGVVCSRFTGIKRRLGFLQ
ncbi:hypothetical protein PAMP_022290 [Pampus punctatissimus]